MPSFRTQNQPRYSSDQGRSQQGAVQPREYPPLGLNDPMPFGKFKTCSIKSIIDKKSDNPIYDGGSYIQWCLENIDTFTLTEEAQRYFEEHHEPKELKRSERSSDGTRTRRSRY